MGAIGSHLAEMLAKLGAARLTLIDPDEVDTVNLGVQGFYEAEVGEQKTAAVSRRLRAISSEVQVTTWAEAYRPELIEEGAAVFSCVDSMRVRRQIFRHYRERSWGLFLDGRMAAESLRVFCIERSAGALALYEASLFPGREAHREGCTARATIYCAALAAALLCAQFKKWVMGQAPEPHLHCDLVGMEIFR